MKRVTVGRVGKGLLSGFLAAAVMMIGIRGSVQSLVTAAAEEVLAQFQPYYSADLQSKAPVTGYWKENDGVITRTNSTNPGGEYKDMAALYYNVAQYKAFVFEAEYKYASGKTGGAFVGFDVTPGSSWKDQYGGTIFWATSGYGRVRGSFGASGNVMDGWGNTGSSIGNYANIEWHSVKIQVTDTPSIQVTIDGVLLFSSDLGSWYDGGSLALASNVDGTQFRNISVSGTPLGDAGTVFDATLSNFDSYYAADASAAAPAPTVYWQEEDGVISRVNSTSPGGEYKDMAMLYYNVAQYQNFTMELDYRYADGATGGAFVGFDMKPGSSWNNQYGGTIFWATSGYGRVRGSFGASGGMLDGWGNTGNSISGYAGIVWHHAKIEVAASTVKVTIDGVTLFSSDLGLWYDGGYLALASNVNGTQFRNITVTGTPYTPFDNYATQYSSDLSTTAPVNADSALYWRESSDGTLTRLNSTNPGGEYKDMAILYYDVSQYQNFTMELDYQYASGATSGAFIGVDMKLGSSWKDQYGGTLFWATSGYGRVRGSFAASGNVLDGWGNTGNSISGYAGIAWHHAKVEVADATIKVTIDGVLLFSSDLGAWYDGGYLAVASNVTGTMFKNITVTGTPYTPFENYGTQYSSNLSTTAPADADSALYWRESSDGTLTRLNSTNPGGEYKDMAILYYNVAQYQDYVMEVDYKYASGATGGAFIGVDMTPGSSWSSQYGGTLFWATSGYGRVRGSFGGSGGVADGWGNTGGSISGYTGISWHHVKIEVRSSWIKVTIDDVLLFSSDLGSWYDGGYIALASNVTGTQFKNLTVEALSSDFSLYDSYYTERVGTDALASSDPNAYWSENNGTITRSVQTFSGYEGSSWNQSNYHLGKMAVLYLKGEYTAYENYTIDLDYKSGTGAWGRAYIGFGAEEGKDWRETDGGVAFFTDSGGSTGFEGNINANGTISTSVFGKTLTGFNGSATHHFQLVCMGGVITIYVDGTEVKTLIENAYLKGGRLYIASNSTGATFSNITVTELPDASEGGQFDGYDEWFGANIATGSLTDVAEGTNWSIYNGTITRKTVGGSTTDTQNKLEMAYLYLNEKQYTNFKLELDYKHGSNGWRRAGVGFGAALGKDFMEADGGIITFSQPDGLVHFDGNVSTNGKYAETVFWSTVDDEGNELTKITPYNAEEWHHLVLTVQDGYATVQIDEFPYYYEISLPSTYAGGYLYLCANSATAQFKNLTIEDLTVDPGTGGSGTWTPSQEDTAFDFSARKQESGAVIAEWKFKKITVK